MNKRILISLLLIIVSLTWAGSFVVVKIGTNEINPIDLGFLRFLIATPIMFVFLLLKTKKTPVPIKEVPYLIILGLTGVTLLYIFQFTGINYTTATTGGVLINTNVIFIVILSALFLKEKFSRKKLVGIILSFSGAIVVITAQMTNENIVFSELFFIGSLLMLLSALCWAIYSTVGKRLLAKYDPLTITTYAFGLGTLFYLPVVIPNITAVIPNISVNGWMTILYLAILCSVFGYVAWYYALSKIDASKAAVFLNFIPLFTIVLSFFIMSETPTILFLFGAILIIYGIYLTQKS